MINVSKLRFAYKGDRTVLHDVAFDSGEGRFIAVLGNNGAGKSTLIKCLNRILKPISGSVTIDGKNIGKLKRADVAKIMSYVAQHNAAERFTVFDTVLLGRKPYIKFEPAEEDLAMAKAVIDRMGLTDKTLRYIDEMSGGERQKVMIARALAQQPKVLLLDEPTSNLDLHNQHDVLKTLKEISLTEKMVVIIVIHDLNLALRYCDSFLLVKDGAICASGGIEIMTPENIQNVYNIAVTVESVRGFPVVVPVPAS